MKKFFKWLWPSNAKDNTDDTGFLYNRIGSLLFFLTILIVILFLTLLGCNKITGITTFLSVAGASLAGGAAFGFLFGLPRSEKYRFIKKEDIDHNSREYSYGDNTNLEEVSDWLTKIIVGITLIKFNTILGWLNQSAVSVEKVFASGCKENTFLNAYVFGYSVIILYFLAGAGLCYLWARTNLSLILTKSRKRLEEIEKRKLITTVQALANEQLNERAGLAELQPGAVQANNLEEFKKTIQTVYNARTIKHLDDLQKERWGGKASIGDKIIEAFYDDSLNKQGLYGIRVQIRSTSADNPLTGLVAFFMHDTFKEQIRYQIADNNKVETAFVAYEAFVIGARLEDGTELELDLQKVNGFPDRFYY